MRTLPRRALRALAIAILCMPAPAVVAAQPSAMALNPEPPDGYACTPIGNGTVCELADTVVLDPEPIGITCQTAAGPFEVFDQATRTLLATRWYDRDGNLVKRVRVNLFADAQLSNPAAGTSVSYAQRDRDVDVFLVPGDLSSGQFTSTNSLTAVAPGIGAVLVEHGRVAAAPDGELLQFTGRRDVADLFSGDPVVLARLCEALAG